MTSQKAPDHICVIGAGLTGLVCACTLAAAGYRVTVLESNHQPGGMIADFQWGQTRVEYLYHHLFTTDRLLVQLIESLGLKDQLIWFDPSDALVSNSRFYPFTGPWDLLRFPLIPLSQRLRTGLAVLRAGRMADWQHLEEETASDWLIRYGGEQAYTCIWKPLLRSKFDRDADEVSAVWIWNKFKLRGGSRDQRSGSERLGYLRGSFGRLTDALTDLLLRLGGRLHLGHTAMNIAQPADGPARYRISCILEDCQTVHVDADGVVAATAPRPFLGITTALNFPQGYVDRLTRSHYKADLCLVLRLKKSLSPYYWTTICDQLPFVVVVEQTQVIDPAAYGGHVVYLSRYLDVTDPLWTQPDGVVFRQFLAGLESLYPHFSPHDVIDWRLRRTRYAQPVISRNHQQQIPSLETPLPGLKLAGTAQIYPEDRGLNYAVRLAFQAARSIHQDSSQKPQAPAEPLPQASWLLEQLAQADP